MATEKLVQNSFVNGQYDREVQSKERTDFIGQGLAKALNVVSSEKGELRKRLGTRFLKSLDGASVLVPFRKPNGDDIVLVCTDGNIKGYEFKGNSLEEFTVPTGVAPTFPDTGWLNNDTNGDYTVALSAVTDYRCFNAPPGSNPYWPESDYTNVQPDVSGETTYIQIKSTNTQIFSKLTVKWSVVLSGKLPNSFVGWIDPVLQYSDDGSNWVSVQTKVVNPGYGDDPKIGYEHTYIGINNVFVSTNNMYMEIQNVTHNTPHLYWRIFFTHSRFDESGGSLFLNVSDVTYISSVFTPFNYNDVFFDKKYLVKIKYSQHNTQMVMACVGKDPIQLEYQAGALTLTQFSYVSNWGQPSCVQHFQQRLWFGGFDSYPTTVIASKIDDYTDFTEQTPLQFDDYLELKCNQLRTQITNITGGQKVLYTFSEDGLALVDSGTGGMIATNQSIEFNLRNRMPSGDATPAYKDDIMLYGSSDGTKLYAVDYDLMTERFQVDDIAKYAKDIMLAKVTELHYINDESKLIYGLLESGNMFALNYQKGSFQGFFPFNIQDGYIYDIAQIKVGRDYKLLLVTCRNNTWYIEEMPDKGLYVNTNAPFMTQEDKKWATYDNINNNIALDCYQDYSDTVSVNGTLDYENLTFTTDADLSAYIGSQVMLGQLNDESQWVILTVDSTDLTNVYNVTIDAQRGESTTFDLLYVGFTNLPVNLPNGSKIGVVSQGKYMGEYTVDSGVVTLPETVFRATYGAFYESYAFIKVTRPYESMKTVRQINLEVQNTMHLSVGTSLSDMQVLEDINDNTHYDLTNMTMNGGYVIVPGDTPEWEKYIILKSDKGLPFTVDAVEVIMNYSNEGGN